ncbi:MORN repeat-containing protein 2 isoform X2 [Denticeps clupeoides]|uniref:MORN repeat-containing protein 2 isoform X2 n=1 Tax=Denticeps clupeoides TaxID=299321 RepID=UPI0010A3341E|nr:MORN repeat-containing protein 2 isoform X2 [Denticeps clupeoides]
MSEKMTVSYIFPNGDKYVPCMWTSEGECCRTAEGVLMRHGVGKHTSGSGVIYKGEWKDDKMNGLGTAVYPSGAMYDGGFKDNMYNGHGTYRFPDCATYKGTFNNNRLEGKGNFTDAQGYVWTGLFHDRAAPGLKLKLNL